MGETNRKHPITPNIDGAATEVTTQPTKGKEEEKGEKKKNGVLPGW